MVGENKFDSVLNTATHKAIQLSLIDVVYYAPAV
jgi:hypothetical protein